MFKNEQDEPVDFRSSAELMLSGDSDGLFNAANDLQRMPASEAVEVLYLLAIEHGVMEAHLNYGTFLEGLHRTKDALEQYEKAHLAGDPQAALALGQAYLNLERPSEAISWLRTAGEDPRAPLQLSKAYRAVGDEASAVAVLLEGSKLSAEAAVELVTTTEEFDLESSIRLLERHLDNGEVDVLIPLADLYSKAGRSDKEIELLRRSVLAGEPNALHNLGLALWESGHTREGRARLKQAARQGDQLSAKALHNIRRGRRQARAKRTRRLR